MQLLSLSLLNYRSHAEKRFEFNEQVAVFTGPNGSGKTNILDALHYLAFTKGFLNPADNSNILRGEAFFMIEGKFEMDGRTDAVSVGLKRGQAKAMRRNAKEYQKLSEHIGLYPLVLIAPTDIVLITGGSEERRKFIDSLIAQFNRGYLDRLIRYNKLIQQRNALLKQGNADRSLLEILDMQLSEWAPAIHAERAAILNRLEPLFCNYYRFLSGEREMVSLQYKSALHDSSMEELLLKSAERDRVMQYTTEGIHKDDLDIAVNGLPIRRFASQGQQKSILIALKLAQFDLIRAEKSIKPLLLLDDIFEKLDQDRITALMKLVSQQHFGQIFITDSHPERVAEILGSIDCAFDRFSIEPTAMAETQNTD